MSSSNPLAVTKYLNQVWSGRQDIDRLRKCNQCDKAACPDCQLELGKSDCKGCVNMIVSALLEEKAMNKELKEKNEELKIENKELKSGISDMQCEINWQNDKIETLENKLKQFERTLD